MLRTLPWLVRYVLGTLPLVKSSLAETRSHASLISNKLLRTQALRSIDDKAFHCYGGAVLALVGPRHSRRALIDFIVAFQTISDYLDNLCDRAGVVSEEAFRLLHTSMVDAVSPHAAIGDYYALYGQTEERYLRYLVTRCRETARTLPSLDKVHPRLTQLIDYYASLQSLKHLDPSVRTHRLSDYIQTKVPNPDDLAWWELAAATGSTLGMFTLMALAANEHTGIEAAEAAYHAYFPWVCGLHILLDYLIDQEEDRMGGDLNFVFHYSTEETKRERMHVFASRAIDAVNDLPASPLHGMVVRGLLAMYLSDPKVKLQGYETLASNLMASAG
jgi:tetraprenyl-beta-curcumene synthase